MGLSTSRCSLAVPHDDAVALLDAQAAAFLAAAASLSDIELLDPAHCRGWSRLDTVVHMRAGLEELLSSLAARTAEPPTRDAASYWSTHPDDRDDDPVPHVLWLRRTASAYQRPASAVRHLAAVTDRLHAVLEELGPGAVPFQDEVLTTGDLLATWVVELTVHHLDLDLAERTDRSPDLQPATGALQLTRRTLEAVSGGPLPDGLGADATAVLVALGRVPWPPGVPAVAHLPVSL